MVALRRPEAWPPCPKCGEPKPRYPHAIHGHASRCVDCSRGETRAYMERLRAGGELARRAAANAAWYAANADTLTATCKACKKTDLLRAFYVDTKTPTPSVRTAKCRDCLKAAQKVRDTRRTALGWRASAKVERAARAVANLTVWLSSPVGSRPRMHPILTAVAVDVWDRGGRKGPQPLSPDWFALHDMQRKGPARAQARAEARLRRSAVVAPSHLVPWVSRMWRRWVDEGREGLEPGTPAWWVWFEDYQETRILEHALSSWSGPQVND